MIHFSPVSVNESIQDSYLKLVIGPILPRMLFGMAFLICLSASGYLFGLTANPSRSGGALLLALAIGICLLALVIRRAAVKSDARLVRIATVLAASMLSAGPCLLAAHLNLSLLYAVPYSVLISIGAVTFWMSTRHYLIGQLGIFLPPILLVSLSHPSRVELSFGIQILVVATAASTALFFLMQRVTQSSFKMTHELEHRATLDGLTGVLNRTTWMTRAATRLALSRGLREAVSCLYIDLNRFKEVNDELGHSEGDRMLEIVASAIGEVLDPDNLFGRVGGDEFAILATGTNRAEAQALRDRIHEALTLTTIYDGSPVASIGIATAASYESLDDIVSRADMDMLESKRRSRLSGHGSSVRISHYDSRIFPT
jgi:diguanylate cyclase (GGDEF)-like protein